MTSELWPLLEDLNFRIDDLSVALKPLLKHSLPENTAKLPLVDQAKLYVSTTYAIESLLFSYIDLNGDKAKDHPVMTELNRIKQYFNKIREAEAKSTKRENLSLNKEAAGRFIKHALSGNDKYDRERAEQLARERAKAHIRFNELGEPKSTPTPQPESMPPSTAHTDDSDQDGGVTLEVYDNTDNTGQADIPPQQPKSDFESVTIPGLTMTAPAASSSYDSDAPLSALEGRRLYLGNIPFDTTEEQIKDLLKDYNIEIVQLPKNHATSKGTGYAFVDFTLKAEADRALQNLPGQILGDRKINARIAFAQTRTTKKKRKRNQDEMGVHDVTPSSARGEGEDRKKKKKKKKKENRKNVVTA